MGMRAALVVIQPGNLCTITKIAIVTITAQLVIDRLHPHHFFAYERCNYLAPQDADPSCL
jgi:hypothetical protein